MNEDLQLLRKIIKQNFKKTKKCLKQNKTFVFYVAMKKI